MALDTTLTNVEREQKSYREPTGSTGTVAVAVVNPDGSSIGSGGGGGGGAVTVADAADVTQGAIADAAASAGGTGTLSAKLRRISTDLNTLLGQTDGIEGSLSNLDTNAGASSDAAASAGGTGSMSAKLRKISADISTLITNLGYSAPLTPTTYSIVVANGSTNQSANITQNGLTTELIIVAPSINGSGATFQIDILNAAGNAIFTQSSYAESTTHRILINRNIISTDTIKITASITVGADKTFSVQVR